MADIIHESEPELGQTNMPDAADNEIKDIPEIWNKFNKVNQIASQITMFIGIIAAVLLVCVIVIDVIGSKLFRAPFPGSIEVLGFIQLMAISFAMTATYLAGHHIKIDLFIGRLAKKPQAIIRSFVNLLGFLLFVVIVWQLLDLAKSFQDSGEVLDQVFIPMYPVIYVMAIAFIPMCLALFYQLGNSINRMVRK